MSKLLWQKEGVAIDAEIQRFLAGDDVILDREFIAYDIRASRAHAQGLQRIGLLADSELHALERELDTLAEEVIEADGLVTPGLVDCHTHAVFAGDRAGEFELRLQGASYEEIARSGGGILSSVRAVREASEEELLDQSAARVASLVRDGVTTLQIKSGYGLDFDN